jgi:hypothetical protein
MHLKGILCNLIFTDLDPLQAEIDQNPKKAQLFTDFKLTSAKTGRLS